MSAIKGVGAKSISSMIIERNKNGKFISIIDFLNRVSNDVINKRQLEKLIQAGAFDSVEKNRSKLFSNVTKFVDLFGGQKNDNQNLLFEDRELSFNDKNLFLQKYKSWKNLEILKNELEVIGFYFSDHPLNYYPKLFFDHQEIKTFKFINENKDNSSIKLCGAILDIKERSNKDGKKYAFITVSEIDTQYELAIFSENLYRYRSLLKEGNLLIFNVDIIRNSTDERLIIKNIELLSEVFNSFKIKFNIYGSINNILEFKDKIFNTSSKSKYSVNLFINIENKLVNFDFDNYSIKSFKFLDDLKESNLLDYSLDIS